MAQPCPPLLVIGYGNTLRRDDGLGWQAAEALRARVAPAQVDVLTVHQLTIELAERITTAGLLLLIDAAQSGTPGAITAHEVAPGLSLPDLTHYLDPPALLAAAQALYGRAPRALLFTVAGQSFAFGEGLSPVVQAALPELLDRLEAAITAHLRHLHQKEA